MSMDLYVWKRPRVTDEDEATRLLELDDENVFEPSADLERFYAELLERFPPPESFTAVELDTAEIPWAESPEGSNRLVSLSIRWSAKGEDLDTIVELAREYELMLYDPQGPSFHSPADPDEDKPCVPTLGEYARGALLTCIGLLLMVLAWKASIVVLSWIVLFVGGFVTLVSVFSLGALAHQTWSTRASRAR
jgi:hypothetical protein